MSIFDERQERPKSKRLRLKTVKDLERFSRRVIRESYTGDLPVSRGRVLTGLIRETVKVMETASLAARLDALERQLSGRGAGGELVSEDDRAALRQRIKKQMAQREEQAEPSPLNETVEPEDDTLDMFGENGDADTEQPAPAS